MSTYEVIRASQLTKKYGGVCALDHVDITVKQGEIYGLVGNNGAGKTTFLKMITGQCSPTSGELSILSKTEESEKNKARKRTGSIIETPSFYPKLTVEKNMEYYRIQRGIPGKDTVDHILTQVGLLDAKKKKFDALSLGMKQRLGLALALIGEPEFLILDEPINGLDPTGIIEIRNLLLKLNREKNITILISSHILTELSNIATTYGFLDKGILIEQITAEKLSEKCNTYLDISVTDSKKYCALLETKLSCDNYKVMPENHIRIFEVNKKMEDYSSLAILNGIGLLSMEEKRIDLENYYMNLIESVNQ